MASTYSDLKIELIGTGEQSGTWGTTTNNNLGNNALGEAITGTADITFASADFTLTLTDTNASQAARNLRLNLIGTTGGAARNLILGSGCQIEKLYIINNACANTITVKNTTGTGIAVAAGNHALVYNDGTNVVNAINFVQNTATSGANANITSLLGLTTPLSTAQGGTGSASTTYCSLTSNVTGTLPVANGGNGLTATPTNGQVDIGNGSGFTRTTLTGTSNQVVVTNGAGSITLSTPQSIATTSSVQFGSLGVSTAASGTAGEIRATNNVTAFYSSDKRLKENIKDVESPLEKVCAIGSKTFDWTDDYIKEHGGEDSYFVQKSDFGVIAQDVQTVFPQAVRTRDDGTLAVDYEKLSTLAFGAIKELVKRIEILEAK